jgi:hypothetical protein
MGTSSEENLSLRQKSTAIDKCPPLSEASRSNYDRPHPGALSDLSQDCRITGNGVRQSLAILQRYILLEIRGSFGPVLIGQCGGVEHRRCPTLLPHDCKEW